MMQNTCLNELWGSFSKEDCITPWKFKRICHEVIKNFLKRMPRSLKKVMCIFQLYLSEMLPFSERTTSMEKIPYLLQYMLAHLRALLQSNDRLYQRNVALSVGECCMMLHGGVPQLPQGMPHDFKWWRMRSMLLPLKSELILCFKICCPSREQHAYISLWRELWQLDAGTAWDKHHPIVWARQPVKIEFHFSLALAQYNSS